jgi:vacuolar protein sorting-associated protein 26
MEVQIVRREVIFGDKKCEPAYVARYELIDGVPTKNERIPIRFFLKSYNLTPTYQNVDNVFCVRYFLNLVIADEEDNRYFKQKEICLFRLYKERKKYYNNNNYN